MRSLIFLTIFALTILASTFCYAEQEQVISRARIDVTGDLLVKTGKCLFYGILVQPDGTNDVSVTIYDGTDDGGRAAISTMDFDGDGGTKYLPMANPVAMKDGIFVDIGLAAGTVNYTVFYRNR
jgi:hypothetical protein